ncbi:TPA: transporter [Escherichia coli]|nr:transporter [Escherichia coli]
MGIKQHNGNTKADRLAELKIRSPSIQLIKFGAIGLNAIIFSPLLIAADTGSQYGTNITIMMVTELQEIPPIHQETSMV